MPGRCICLSVVLESMAKRRPSQHGPCELISDHCYPYALIVPGHPGPISVIVVRTFVLRQVAVMGSRFHINQELIPFRVRRTTMYHDSVCSYPWFNAGRVGRKLGIRARVLWTWRGGGGKTEIVVTACKLLAMPFPWVRSRVSYFEVATRWAAKGALPANGTWLRDSISAVESKVRCRCAVDDGTDFEEMVR